MTRNLLALAGGLALLSNVPAAAFQSFPDGTTAEERAHTARLNAEQAARAQAEIAAFQQQVAAIEAQAAAAASSYAQETAAYEAEKARIAAMAAEARMRWEADVAACRAGDANRCAPRAPMPQR